MSQLRRTLDEAEPGARGLVVFGPSGYLLDVSADAVDASRFGALTAQARASTDPEARARLLTEALALWRGSAFADFSDEEFARAAIQRLDEHRLVALEEHAEARLELGEHGVLAGELGDLLARYPLRERLWAVRLRALYHAGRQSEALASYQELRQRLADELGLDPGPELVALHRAILNQDPELAPAISAPRRRTNLPAPLTELIGRAEAVRDVRSLLAANRLVTLTGPGGVGKTRLAIAAAGELVDAFPDGVWLVELAGHRQPTGTEPVADVVAATLGVRDDPESADTAAGRLTTALAGKRLLLVLDNCEHVVGPVAELAEPLLRAAPELRILVTSQERLGTAGESRYPVEPLDTSDPAAGAQLDALLRSSAVRLFVARAAASAPGFRVDSSNAEAVAGICRRLDGIPLALELAATPVRLLGVHELNARLDDRFRLPAGRRRGAPPRQRTLRAMIEWSWGLLTEPERVVLRRLAVHAESFSLAAAESVGATGEVAASDVLGLLDRLVDRSLVTVGGGPGGPRYRLLESVAAYFVERLDEVGELDRASDAHRRYYGDLAERAEPHLYGRDQRRWLDLIDTEMANVRVALDGAVRRDDATLALRVVNALAWYWFLRGRLRERHRWTAAALAVAGGTATARARAVTWHAGFVILLGEDSAPGLLAEKALAHYESVDDPLGHARARWLLSTVLLGSGDPTVHEDRVNQALATFRELGDHWGVAAALCTRATQAQPRGDLAAARLDGEHAAALFGEFGDRWGRLKANDVLATVAEITGDYERTARLHRDGLRDAEELGLLTEVSYRLSGLGRIALLTGDYVEADRLHRQAMRLAAGQSHKRGEQFAEVGLGLTARRQGRLDAAERHLRAWLDWCRRIDGDLGAALILAGLGFVAEQRGDAERALALHQDGFAAARATGDPRALALALEGLAGAWALAGQHEHAARLLGAAVAARESVGAPLPPAERGDVDRIAAAVRAVLSEEAFAAAVKHGRTLDPDTAVRHDRTA